MAKKLRKSEKLDLILSELAALRADLKTLLQRGVAPDKAPGPAKAGGAKKAAKPKKAAKAPTRPVLVEAAESDAPAAGLASRIA
ncbi:MAG TPA: hypothetical protein VFR00_03350 [Hyphomicrobiaceae bacterium]|nr:hypothetical protein [Hyphomicrobiaceae bacterium]